MSVVLQPQVTLDEALLGGVKTFRNGCNFRLRTEADGSRWLEYGCYGVLVNLATGHERLLLDWMGRDATGPKSLEQASPETINVLLKRDPCRACGGALFAAQFDKASGRQPDA